MVDWSVETFSAGQEPQRVDPADVVLVYGSDIFCRAIRVGQRLRFRGNDRGYAEWNHVALVVDDLGSTIEAFSSGVRRGSLHGYKPVDYVLIRPHLSDEDRLEAVGFAVSCLNDGYGWLTILSIGVSLLTGTKLSFGYDGQEICSGLVARSLEHGGVIFPRDAARMMPADIARWFGVKRR